MPARRCEQRIQSILPVRVYGTNSAGAPFNAVAHTLDLSRHGVRIGGLRQLLEPGDIVGIQRGNARARFRVTWVGEAPRAQDQFGLVCMEPEKNLWNLDQGLPARPDQPEPSPLAIAEAPQGERGERRTHPRVACDLGVELSLPGTAARMWAHCSDISMGGCYVNTRTPLSTGSELTVVLRSERRRLAANAIVRTTHPQVGMGLQFQQLTDADRDVLRMVMAEVTGNDQPERVKLAPTPVRRHFDAQLRAVADRLEAIVPVLEDSDIGSVELAELRGALQHTLEVVEMRIARVGTRSLPELAAVTQTVS